ncbi:MAG: hypothetical protein IEMM0008_0059 [bacterium]|nr:MAG: hypothetical protein IEMM0008_0059 [bacterium]
MLILLKLLPKRFIGSITGFLTDFPFPKWFLMGFLKMFVKVLKVNMEEAVYHLSHYRTVNEFFTRPIKQGQRPINGDPNTIVSPVDGRIIEKGDIVDDKALQIKGVPYSITKLIKHEDFSSKFLNGHFITLYLSPKDYHRIHVPYNGTGIAAEYNRGALFPVNNLGLHNIQNLFAINERLTTFFETSFGLSAIVKVAAMNVGRIKTTYEQPWTHKEMKQKKSIFSSLDHISYVKGDEFARFELGSTVILLFEKDAITFLKELGSGRFLKMGETFAHIK